MLNYKKFDTTRKFGVELEVGNSVKKPKIKAIIKKNSDRDIKTSRYALTTSNSYWHIKDDATCGPTGRDGPKGIEIATFIASGLKDLEHIAEISKILSESKVEVNHHCGLHIHADAADIKAEQAGRIIANWLKIERFLSLALPMRRYSVYCEFLHTSIDKKEFKNFFGWPYQNDLTAMDFYETFMPRNLAYYSNSARRVNLNFVNYYRGIITKSDVRKTIELRWPEGTLSDIDIRNWVKLYLNFIEHAKDLPIPVKWEVNLEDFLNILGLGNNYILDEHLMETKIWLLERLWYNESYYLNKYISSTFPVEKINGKYFASQIKIGMPIVEKQDILKYLNFISDPFKKYENNLKNNAYDSFKNITF